MKKYLNCLFFESEAKEPLDNFLNFYADQGYKICFISERIREEHEDPKRGFCEQIYTKEIGYFIIFERIQ